MDPELEVLTRIARAFDDALDNALTTRDKALAELEDNAQRARAEVYLRDRFAARFTEQLFPPRRRTRSEGVEGPKPTPQQRKARGPNKPKLTPSVVPNIDTETGEPREAWGQ